MKDIEKLKPVFEVKRIGVNNLPFVPRMHTVDVNNGTSDTNEGSYNANAVLTVLPTYSGLSINGHSE